MAENNRLHIQHYYTTGNTVPSADNVKLGEIAVGAGKDNEKLIIKNNENGIVKFLPEGADTSYIKTDGNTSLGENEGGINIDGSTIEIYQGADVSVIISDETGDEKAQLYSYGNYVEATPSGVAISSTSEVAISTNETSVSLDNSGFGIEVKEDGTDTTHTLTFNDLGSLKVNGKSVLTDETYKGTITGVTIEASNGLATVEGSNEISANSGSTSGTIKIKGTAATNKGRLGVSVLYDGDLKDKTYQDGAAAAASHYHSQYATTGYVDQKVAALVDGAPEALNTLDELAAALKDNADIVDVLNQSIGTKQNTIEDLETIRNNAASGATAFSWGNHADAGYTKNTGTITEVKANGTSLGTSGVVNIPSATTDVYGVTKLSNATNSNDGTIAATPKAVKSAYDLADAKYSKPSGGIPKSDLDSDVQDLLDKAKSALQSETYKGTITGVTAGSGLTDGGSASSGATSVTLNVACGEGLEIDETGNVTLSKIVDREDINEENGTFCVSDGDDKNAIVSMIGFDEYGRNSGYTLRRITTISCGTF